MDWKNPADYAYTKDLPPTGWAWEFLRRNPEYRASWEALAGETGSLLAKHGPFAGWTKKAKLLETEEGAWTYRPAKFALETPDAWQARVLKQGGNPVRRLRPIADAEPWFIDVMHDPAYAQPWPQFRNLITNPPIWGSVDQIANPASELYDELGLGAFTWFDLTDNLDPQIERLRKNLEERQSALIASGDVVLPIDSKARADKYGDYLRILDGRSAGASVGEIAIYVGDKKDDYPDKKGSHKVMDRLKAAQHLVDFGYLRLLRK